MQPALSASEHEGVAKQSVQVWGSWRAQFSWQEPTCEAGAQLRDELLLELELEFELELMLDDELLALDDTDDALELEEDIELDELLLDDELLTLELLFDDDAELADDALELDGEDDESELVELLTELVELAALLGPPDEPPPLLELDESQPGFGTSMCRHWKANSPIGPTCHGTALTQ